MNETEGFSVTSYAVRTIICPRCEAQHFEMYLASGNRRGARYFTDGRSERDSFDGQTPIRLCAECGHKDWISRWPVGASAAENDYFRLDARRAVEGHEFSKYVAEGLWVDEKEEFSLRTLAWWESNKAVSSGKAADLSRQKNIEALLEQCNAADADKLMRAELLRHLGRFDECIAVIRESKLEKDAGVSKFAATILRLALARSMSVEQIP